MRIRGSGVVNCVESECWQCFAIIWYIPNYSHHKCNVKAVYKTYWVYESWLNESWFLLIEHAGLSGALQTSMILFTLKVKLLPVSKKYKGHNIPNVSWHSAFCKETAKRCHLPVNCLRLWQNREFLEKGELFTISSEATWAATHVTKITAIPLIVRTWQT